METRNCLTCEYEPRWRRGGNGNIGECQYEAYPAWAKISHYISHKENGTLWIATECGYEGDYFEFDDCPAHQPKAQSDHMVVEPLVIENEVAHERMKKLEDFCNSVNDAMYGEIEGKGGIFTAEPKNITYCSEILKRHVLIKRALRLIR